MRTVANWPDALKLHAQAAGVGVLGVEHGFEAQDFDIVAEQDILGDRMVRPRTKSKRAQNFLTEASSLAQGDLVCVYGDVLDEGRTSRSLGGALYRVNVISLVDRADP